MTKPGSDCGWCNDLTLFCRTCGAVGYGNATCRDCVKQWPRFGVSQEIVERLLEALHETWKERLNGVFEAEFSASFGG